MIEIRKVGSEDLTSVFEISRKSYIENFAHHWNEGGLEWYLEKVYGKDRMQRDLSGNRIQYFTAYYKGEPAGFMKLRLHSNLDGEDPEKGMEIEKLYFMPLFQGKGIGSRMTRVAIDQARALSKTRIWLGVIDTNKNAIAFYKKMGFRTHDRTRVVIPYFKDELRGMWRMILDL